MSRCVVNIIILHFDLFEILEDLEALLNKIQVDIEVDSNLENLRKGIFKTIPFIRVVFNGQVIILIDMLIFSPIYLQTCTKRP